MFDHIKGMDILLTASCNLKCQYCYIDRERVDNYLHDKIISSIYNHSCFDKIPKEILLNIDSLSVWGREPSFSYKALSDNFDYIISSIPKLNTIVFSTNLVNIKDIDVFIDKLVQYNIKLKLQYSIDFSKRLTNEIRGNGENIYDRILENLESLIKIIKDNNIKNVTLNDRHTFSRASINKMDNIENEVIPYITYIKDLYKKYGINISIFNMGFNNEDDYTKEDGLKFSNIIEQFISLNKKHHTPIPFKGYLLIDKIITCSPNNNSISTYDGLLYNCHRDYFKGYNCTIDDIDKLLYNYTSFHYFQLWKIHYTAHLIYSLASIGQVSRVYADNPSLLLAASQALNNLSCPSYNLEVNGNQGIIPCNIPILFCNGALEKIFEEAKNNV